MGKSISSLKKPSSGSNKLIKRVIAVSVSVLVIVFSLIYLNNVDRAARDTVAVVRVRNDNLPAHAVITRDNIESYDLIRREFEGDSNGMILFEDVDEVLGLLTAFQIRRNTVLYRDQLISERPLRNPWLYELGDAYEIITVPFNAMEAGGNLLLPGDRIRIRSVFESSNPVSDDDLWLTNPNFFSPISGRDMTSETIFDSIVITDMINANGHSIYEIFLEVMRLSEDERQRVMRTSDFISNTRPRALLLAANEEQVYEYARFRSTVGTGSFLITILSRAGSEVILDRLPTIESEVNAWVRGAPGD